MFLEAKHAVKESFKMWLAAGRANPAAWACTKMNVEKISAKLAPARARVLGMTFRSLRRYSISSWSLRVLES